MPVPALFVLRIRCAYNSFGIHGGFYVSPHCIGPRTQVTPPPLFYRDGLVRAKNINIKERFSEAGFHVFPAVPARRTSVHD